MKGDFVGMEDVAALKMISGVSESVASGAAAKAFGLKP